MKTRYLIPLLLGALLFTMGCGMVNALLNQAVPSGSVAADLWPDVPRIDGLTKTNLEMPLAIRLLMQATIKGVMASAGDSNASMQFVAFTTAKTTDDLGAFYTQERMQQAGWNVKDMPGCTTETGGTPGAAGVGALCLFAREDGDKGTFLAVIGTLDDKTKQTDVFYARLAGSISKIRGTATSSGQ
jgi:hypothetical protein